MKVWNEIRKGLMKKVVEMTHVNLREFSCVIKRGYYKVVK